MTFPPLAFTRLEQSNSIAKTLGEGKQFVTPHVAFDRWGSDTPMGPHCPDRQPWNAA
jgi:hypothetical protein